MKTLSELLAQKPVYLNCWSHKIDLIGDFEDIYITEKEYHSEFPPYPNVQFWQEKKDKMKIALQEWDDIHILFASYGQANYSGDAFVLFEKEGQLFEVNGSHCSCYGLEGQFDPEITTLEAIADRLVNGKLGTDDYSGNCFQNELKEYLGLVQKS